MMAAVLALVCVLHGHSSTGPWAALDPAQELDRLEAAVAAQPDRAAPLHALGMLLAREFGAPEAIPALERALALGLVGPQADDARLAIALTQLELGHDRVAVAGLRALQRSLPADHRYQAYLAERLRAVAIRHAALEGVTASERRAIIACVLALLAIAAGFWVGRRLAAPSETA